MTRIMTAIHIVRALVGAAALAFAVPALAMTGDKAEFVKLADDVYAYVGKKNDANAMVVVTSQGVVLVDTGNNQPDTRDLAQKIKSVTDQPVRYVVISQNHGDHIGGTPLFSPPAALVVHDRVAQQLADFKPYQIKTWEKRFPERTEAMKDVRPIDTVVSFPDRMTLHLGGKTIELIYVDDTYNPGDVAVWVPEAGVLHASFAGYKDRHPDIRPDYSHGTTWGMLKQLETYIALKPKVVVPAHGPLGGPEILTTMVDYLLSAREKVRVMMANGTPLPDIIKQFSMSEYKGWDRENHFDWMAETLWRELQGMGPQIAKIEERAVKSATIEAIEEEGRRLTVNTGNNQKLRLRVASDTNIEGIPDRTGFRNGMKISAEYQVPVGGNAALGYDIMEVRVEK
jgi:cyclase